MTAQLAAFFERAGHADYASCHRWSIDHPDAFWMHLWDFLEIVGDRGERVLDPGTSMADARFFPDAMLSFAENLLRRDDDAIAIIAHGADGARRELSFAALRREVASYAAGLRALGVSIGDRVAAALPNTPEAVIAMLAVNSLGAIGSLCDLELGVEAVVDRFGQIEPSVLIATSGRKLDALVPRLPSVEHVVTAPIGIPGAPFEPTRVAFNAPAFILYTSGTTGLPKCIVHNTGGQLLQLLKEHRLHYDLRAGDRYFQQTSTGWNMWYWLVIALGAGATIVLREGSPLRPRAEALFDVVAAERVTHFGLSPAYLAHVKGAGLTPKATHDLSAMRVLASTGSVLSPALFDYVYASIKSDVHLISLSGGTEINACFVTGNPLAPVHRGEIQVAALGMATDVFDEEGRSVTCTKGELVCTKPFPSQPVGLWNDPDRARYLATYFERYPGVWHHGDFIETTEHGGYVIHGRSDATLKPGGHRIGTSEIYRVLEGIEAIEDAVAIGQSWADDVRIVLFVKLRAGHAFDGALEKTIRTTILRTTSAHHVPARIIPIADIPYTRTGKKAELAVRRVVHGEPVANASALANPESLDAYREIAALRR